MGAVEVLEGEVGETEQQPHRKLEQLDVWVAIDVNLEPDERASAEVGV